MKISFGYFKIAFLLLIVVSLNVFSIKNDSVSIFTATEDEAVRVALIKARPFLSEKPALCFTEMIYDCLNEDQVNYFIVVISNEKAKMNKIQAYEVFGNIQKYKEIKSQVITVFVNSDKTREPIIAIKEGLPPYINDHPIFSKLYSMNGNYYIKQNNDFINLYTHQNEGAQPIMTLDLDNMDDIQKINEDNFINKGWDESVLADESINLSATPIQNTILNYRAKQLSWTQGVITSNLDCFKNGGCCYIAAPASILAYYDDYAYNNKGPFEYLVPLGNGNNLEYVYKLAYTLSSGYITSLYQNDIKNGIEKWTNTKNGYNFIYSNLKSPSIDDVKTEISNNRPFLYAIYNNSWFWWWGTNHLVVAVGYKQSGTDFYVIAYTNQHNDADSPLNMPDNYYNWNEPLSRGIIKIFPDTANMKISYPNSSSVWAKGSKGKISWSGFSGSSYVKIELIYPTGKIVVIKSAATTTYSQGSLDWTVDKSLTSNTGYKVRITSTQYPYTQSLTSASFRIK